MFGLVIFEKNTVMRASIAGLSALVVYSIYRETGVGPGSANAELLAVVGVLVLGNHMGGCKSPRL